MWGTGLPVWERGREALDFKDGSIVLCRFFVASFSFFVMAMIISLFRSASGART